MSADLRLLQARLGKWHVDKWGAPSRVFMAAKLAEEVGEVCEAAVKAEQGHPKADQLDYGSELADVVIVALCAASIHGVDLAAEVASKVYKVDPDGDLPHHRDAYGRLICVHCRDEVAYCGGCA